MMAVSVALGILGERVVVAEEDDLYVGACVASSFTAELSAQAWAAVWTCQGQVQCSCVVQNSSSF